MQRNVLRLVPRLPNTFGTAEFVARIGTARCTVGTSRSRQGRRYTWRLAGQSATIEIDIAPFLPQVLDVAAGDSIVVEHRARRLTVQHVLADGRRQARAHVAPDADRSARQARLDAILAPAAFARPGQADAHPSMQR